MSDGWGLPIFEVTMRFVRGDQTRALTQLIPATDADSALTTGDLMALHIELATDGLWQRLPAEARPVLEVA